VAAIVRLADAPADRASLGANARRYAEEFLSIDGVLEKFSTSALRVNQPGAYSALNKLPSEPIELRLFSKVNCDAMNVPK